jgi:tetratricopeptide (TPR) repeat protein
MTNTTEKTSTDSTGARAGIPADEVIAAARDLAHGGRWRRAARLLDATSATDAHVRALLALTAAEVALEGDWFGGTNAAAGRLSAAEQVCATADLDPGSRWDLAFLRLRHEYFGHVLSAGRFCPGPEGKDPDALADLRRRAVELREQAPDDLRRGWAEMYLGLIADNLYGEREAAPAHYEAALRAGESMADLLAREPEADLLTRDSGADLLAREALRHLGDHDHDRSDHQLALKRWGRATALGARAGAVPGTLSQQMLLAVLARESGDEAGAAALAREIARWAAAIGARSIEAQATSFLAGADPTAPPENSS